MTQPYSSVRSAYIHIPFCRRRCYYCDFAISVVGDKLRGETSGTMQEYVQFICQEIAQSPDLDQPHQPLQTIFFGGGTPSLLAVSQIGTILMALDKKFTISANAEISMEVDPGTFDLAQLQRYQNLGVNRLSLGVQAFQDNLLKLAGRSHDLSDIFQSINLIQQANYNNWSLDLISGLPEQTLEDWHLSLKTALEVRSNHISCYDLIVESSTPFAKQYEPGIKPLPEDEVTATMYRLAQQILTTAGYEHYEISNYARSGKQSRHNRVYWQREFYYGFGMAAASYIGNKRFTRPRTRRDYYQWIKDGCAIDTPVLEVEEMFLEALMLGLRLREGLQIEQLVTEFGQDLATWTLENLQPYQKQGWVEFVDVQGDLIINFEKDLETGRLKSRLQGQSPPSRTGKRIDRMRLSDPEGFLFSNAILSTLFHLKSL